MYNFCTLFDSNYLSRGLAMYKSLLKCESDFHVYIVAFDQKCLDVLLRLNLKQATIISLKEFENEALLAVKGSRTRGEYCWTSSSSLLWHCITTYNLSDCTYIDADLFFFNSPRILFEEIGEQSICITEHRYSAQYNKAVKAGKYCVQFVYVKNNQDGMECLSWWKQQCLNWCFNRFEEGKFGDQKYLDEFATRFNNVHELQYLGGGVAPWNIQQYEIFEKHNQVIAKHKKNNSIFELIFYHFHYLRFLKDGYVDFGRYDLTKKNIEIIYKPYLKALHNAALEIEQVDEHLNPHGQAKLTAWKRLTRFFAMHLRWDANIYKINKLG